MNIYRLSIVERDFPKGHPQSKIIDFKYDYEFKSSKGLQKKWYSLKKQGYNRDTIDITVWDRDEDKTYDFRNELDFETLTPIFK